MTKVSSVNLIRSLLFLFCLLCFGCQQRATPKLRIATAANMQYALAEIIDSFTQATGIPCESIIGSSGNLSALIHSGAPYDVFVSANLKYPDYLHQNGLTTGPPQTYAYGKLVLWSAYDKVQANIDFLTDDRVEFIAVANPETAPYGKAAIEVLKHYQIYEQLKKKLVYGESISQTNQFLYSKAAIIGFTAKSVVLHPTLKGKGQWQEVDRKAYSPIAQGVILLNNKEGQPAWSQEFHKFLFSEKSKEILIKFGYDPVVN